MTSLEKTSPRNEKSEENGENFEWMSITVRVQRTGNYY